MKSNCLLIVLASSFLGRGAFAVPYVDEWKQGRTVKPTVSGLAHSKAGDLGGCKLTNIPTDWLDEEIISRKGGKRGGQELEGSGGGPEQAEGAGQGHDQAAPRKKAKIAKRTTGARVKRTFNCRPDAPFKSDVAEFGDECHWHKNDRPSKGNPNAPVAYCSMSKREAEAMRAKRLHADLLKAVGGHVGPVHEAGEAAGEAARAAMLNYAAEVLFTKANFKKGVAREPGVNAEEGGTGTAKFDKTISFADIGEPAPKGKSPSDKIKRVIPCRWDAPFEAKSPDATAGWWLRQDSPGKTLRKPVVYCSMSEERAREVILAEIGLGQREMPGPPGDDPTAPIPAQRLSDADFGRRGPFNRDPSAEALGLDSGTPAGSQSPFRWGDEAAAGRGSPDSIPGHLDSKDGLHEIDNFFQ